MSNLGKDIYQLTKNQYAQKMFDNSKTEDFLDFCGALFLTGLLIGVPVLFLIGLNKLSYLINDSGIGVGLGVLCFLIFVCFWAVFFVEVLCELAYGIRMKRKEMFINNFSDETFLAQVPERVKTLFQVKVKDSVTEVKKSVFSQLQKRWTISDYSPLESWYCKSQQGDLVEVSLDDFVKIYELFQ